MPTTNKGFEQPAANSTNWDVPLNANFGYIDSALGGTVIKSVTGIGPTPVVLTAAEYRNLGLFFSGTLTANVTYQIPAGVGGQWVVSNDTTGAFTLTIALAGYPFTLQIPQGSKRTVYSTGLGIDFAETNAGTVTSVAVSGGTTGLTTSGGPITSSGTITLAGTLALANGGTGATDAAGALTNIVGFTPVQQGGGTGMGANKIRLGWGSSGNLLAQVDATSVGDLVRRTNSLTFGVNSELIALGSPPLYACRAWVSFVGTTGSIYGGGNVTSVTNVGTGLFQVAFNIAMPDTNYAAVVSMKGSNTDGSYSPSASITSNGLAGAAYTTTALGVTATYRIFTQQGGRENAVIYNVAIFR